MSLLSIRKLTKAFTAFVAVDNLDLDVAEGEFVSLLGPSGCGKTTTLRCVAGLEAPTSGSIRFGDKEVTALPPEKRQIGMVFQNYALFPHMMVHENIGFGLEMRGIRGPEAAKRISDVLDMVQLSGFEERHPRQLSGGQQQRVALARALVIEPALLLLDEPLANLDAKLRDEMRFFIRSLQKRVGITTLYVTHDQAESMTMSDRIVVMFGGRVHQIGAPRDIYHRPATREVANFIGQANLIAGRLVEQSDGAAIVETAFGRLKCLARDGLANGAVVTAMVRPEAVRVAEGGDGEGLHGHVQEQHFLGNLLDYRIAMTDGSVILAQALGGNTFTAGQTVTIKIDETKTWILA